MEGLMAPAAGKTGDLPAGIVKAVQLEGKTIALANVDGQYYAVDDVCPHRGCSLATGLLAGSILSCPCHGSQFDVTNGAVVRGPASTGVESYPVTLAGDE